MENAERYNYENALVISAKPIVEKYQSEFNKLWKDL